MILFMYCDSQNSACINYLLLPQIYEFFEYLSLYNTVYMSKNSKRLKQQR